MTLPTPEEAAARVGKYEERLGKQPTSFVGSLIEAYGADTNFAETIETHCADLRALLAARTSLAAERDRLAGALEELAIPRGVIWHKDMTDAELAKGWAKNTELMNEIARAALAQPERREGSDGR